MSTTGVAGLTLGCGWLERKLGLTADNLLSAEVVLADGSVVTASEREHPDLFRGLRGGSGNLGVVTSFEFRLHPVGPVVLGGMLLHRGERAPEVLRAFRDFMAEAPDEVAAAAALFHRASGALPAGGRARAARRGGDPLLRGTDRGG